MAAKEEAYTGLSLFTGDCEHLVAKLDTDYSTFKLRFYLDEVIGGKEGVVGLVNPSGINATYHNLATRQGKGRFGNYVALNDGGLNTLGTVSIGTLSSIFGLGVIIPITYRNAFYVASDDIRIMYRKNGSPTWIEYSSRAGTPQGEELTYNGLLTSETGDLHPNDLVYVKVKNVNAEGTFISGEQSLTLPRPPLIMGFDGSYASYAYTNFSNPSITKNTYYFSEFDANVGVLIAEDPTGTINTATGYFACLDFWIKVELNADVVPKTVITKMGAIETWDTGDPATPATYYEYTFYHFEGDIDRWNIACPYLQGTGDPHSPVTLYRSVADDRYYTSTFLTTYASDGLYYTDKTNFKVLQTGQDVGDGNCTTGPFVIE